MTTIDLKELARRCVETSSYQDCAEYVNAAFGSNFTWKEFETYRATYSPLDTLEQVYLRTVEHIARDNGFSVVNHEATKLDPVAREALERPDEEGVDHDVPDTGRDSDESCDEPGCPDHPTPQQAVLDIVDGLQRRLDEALGKIAGAEAQEKAAKEMLEAEQRSSSERGALAEKLSAQVAELEDQRAELINEKQEILNEKRVLAEGIKVSVDLRGRLEQALEKLQSETLRCTMLERQLDVVKAEREVEQQRERLKQAEVQLANRKASLRAVRANQGELHNVKARYDQQTGHWVALEDSVPHVDVHAETARKLFPELLKLTDDEIRKNHAEKRSRAKAFNLWNQYNTMPAPVGLAGVEVDGDTVNFVVDGTSARTFRTRAFTDLPEFSECTIEEPSSPSAVFNCEGDRFRACYIQLDTPKQWRGIFAYGNTPRDAHVKLLRKLIQAGTKAPADSESAADPDPVG